MKPSRLVALLPCIWLAGCALYGTGRLGAETPGVMRAGATPPQAAAASIRPGATTKPELAASLGRATVVSFGTGWEVWVYRWPGPALTTASATELVVLFDPSGTVRKVRVRG